MPTMVVDDTLAYLTGVWVLERAITDHHTGVTGLFEGDGVLQTAGGRGRYEERGRLRFAGYDGSAQRALDILGTVAGTVAVHFTDGRPFFELNLLNGTCDAVHRCGLDRYELRFEARSPNLLLERWRVTGPAKDYEARTTWRRRSFAQWSPPLAHGDPEAAAVDRPAEVGDRQKAVVLGIPIGDANGPAAGERHVDVEEPVVDALSPDRPPVELDRDELAAVAVPL